jgi:hypothetical protein
MTTDPGADWADEVLAPLRREQVSCEVAPTVMRRIRVMESRIRPLPFPLARPGLAWASSLGLGLIGLGIVAATLVAMILGGDEGARQVWALTASAGRTLLTLGRTVVTLGVAFVTVAVPLLRGVGVLLSLATPLLRGAGLLVATLGALSIIVSTYVFTHARKVAPVAGHQGGFR